MTDRFKLDRRALMTGAELTVVASGSCRWGISLTCERRQEPERGALAGALRASARRA